MKTLLLLSLFVGVHVQAEGLDDASKDALSQTQTLLKTPAARQKYIDSDPAAKAADAKLDALTGPGQDKEAIYNLSGDIFGKLVEKANGDPAKIKEILKNADANPEAFMSSLTPDQQNKIRDIAGKLQKQSGVGHPN
jgi:ABC-type uncharacterized transport system YnjBCD substrate-binding protein